MTSTFIVPGNWRVVSSADIDLEAQIITGTHASFTVPSAPELTIATSAPIRTPLDDAIDDFFGVTRPRATHESRHDSQPSFGCGGGDVPPPPYADPELPAYSADPSTEPATLAMYLFKFGFLFPPFWVLGAVILVLPLTAPETFEPTKSGRERREMVRIIRDVEVRWARRCVLALLALIVLGSVFAVAVIV